MANTLSTYTCPIINLSMRIICLSAYSLFNYTVHQQFHFTIPSQSIKTNLLLWPFPHYGRRIWIVYTSSWIFTFRLWNRKFTNLLSFQVVQSSPMTLSFSTLNSYLLQNIAIKSKIILFYICAMRVQFKRFSLLPHVHITDLYYYTYPLVLNTGHLYKLLLWY